MQSIMYRVNRKVYTILEDGGRDRATRVEEQGEGEGE